MVNKYSVAALLLLGGFSSAYAQSQDLTRVQHKEVGEKGMPTLIQFRLEGKTYQMSEARKALAEQLDLTADDQLQSARIEADPLGFVHEKFAQYYKGVKVEHAEYTVHARQGVVESMSGNFERVQNVKTAPTINEQAALQRALRFVGGKKYMWEDAGEEATLKEQENNPRASYKPEGELVIVDNTQAEPGSPEFGQPTLAWKFNIYSQQPVSRAYIYVDAQTGDIVAKDAIIKHAAATGTFATRYSGTKTSATESINGSFRLRELTRGSGIETYNCNKGNSYTTAVDFTDADNSWTEYANANFDNAALDAHYGAQSTYDYFKNVHARNSYNNAGAKIKSYVHFDDTPGDGKGYENAYWNGSVMTYGDGYTRFDPLTSLDVAAHEIGHAVCSSTANLTYSYESGALNEGFSDIWGAAVEYYKDPNKATWLIGEDIDKVRPSLRSMSNPNAESQPDTYKGTYWYATSGDNGGVHTNSGVLNHWFYRLAVGGSGTNDIGSSFSVTGIGIDAAAKIAYRTESVYLTASSNYAAARTYSIQSATDLYGAGSAQVIATTNAWYAVGVGAAYSSGGGTTTPTYCTSKGTNVAYEWIDYVKLGTLARTSGADGGYYNGTALSAPSIGAGTSQTISFSAGFASTAYTEYWKVYIDYNQDGDFIDSGESVVSGSSSSSGTLSATFTVPSTAKSGNTRMRVLMSDASATTSCNSYSYGETEDYTVSISGGAALTSNAVTTSSTSSNATLGSADLVSQVEVYPNPAADVLRVTLPNRASVVSVQVADMQGRSVKGTHFDSKGELNVARLASGMYMLSVSDGQKTFRQRFVKQ
ncbi:peptidase M4 thermolysin [Hymenobacter roseosalivarius DSM 11622]|uniref:Peptidase M4 thermolysin n=1 Tax=Hymenobacter roseosalivarius DSM 11622 TaxID=645990 RepID=A0A1W1VLQ8_9BACT|nr:M4 family metallopeptidase [Hymenobacter roseosalivarius]SMB94302.1 peptidase M4 thermolysin [Hymenobacter roseosalivarius DSM 11622]